MIEPIRLPLSLAESIRYHRQRLYRVVDHVTASVSRASAIAAEFSTCLTPWHEAGLLMSATAYVSVSEHLLRVHLVFSLADRPALFPHLNEELLHTDVRLTRDNEGPVMIFGFAVQPAQGLVPLESTITGILTQQSREELIDSVIAKNNSLQIAVDSARRADSAKARFLASISHELRTPLNAITNIVAVMKAPSSAGDISGLLDGLGRASDRLAEVISNLLDYTDDAIVTEQELADHHLATFIQTVLAGCQQRLLQCNLKPAITLDPRLPVDMRLATNRVQRLLRIYLDNACKFAVAGALRIIVRPVTRPSGEVYVRISVIDEGPGISSENADRLFTALAPLDDSLTRATEGAGLGLVLAAKIAASIHGAAGYSSAGEGSEFWFELPLQPADTSRTVHRPVMHAFAHSRRVLLVDDNPLNLQLGAVLLKNAGVDVDQADDGAVAVRMASENSYGLILMDLQMPGVSGFDATRQIRTLFRHRQTPVYAWTANVTSDVRRECDAAGINGFLEKPANKAAIVKVLLDVGLGQSGQYTA